MYYDTDYDNEYYSSESSDDEENNLQILRETVNNNIIQSSINQNAYSLHKSNHNNKLYEWYTNMYINYDKFISLQRSQSSSINIKTKEENNIFLIKLYFSKKINEIRNYKEIFAEINIRSDFLYYDNIINNIPIKKLSNFIFKDYNF
jgi:hypothetical protein